MDKVKTQARDYKIYLSRSEDPKKNPLDVRYKLRINETNVSYTC